MAIITGTSGANVINGTAGGDIILAGKGNDTVSGGNGNDIIDGGEGNDTIDGGAGTDLINGGDGNDTINGGAGLDILYGDDGNDTMDGGAGSDLVLGGKGNDTLVYNASENIGSYDIYDGGDGRDTLKLVVSQAVANSAAFQHDIAALNAQLSHGGSASLIFSSLNLTVTSIEQLQIVIQAGTNNAPTAQNDSVSTSEDAAVTVTAASLLANDTDADAGDGKTLVSVQNAQNGTVSYNTATGAVTFTPAANASGTGSFTYTMRDTAGATSTATVTVNIAAVADAPTLTVANAAGNEDSAITLSVSRALTDTDGSESISALVVSAIPVGAKLTDGAGHTFTATSTANSSVDISGWTLSGLKITPPANSDVDFVLTVTATSREGLSGPTASTTSTLAVTVNPLADAPTLTVANATGNEDSAITLSITPAVTDGDGSESISALVVSAIPVGAKLTDGAGHTFTATSAANSSVDISGWTLSGLKITPPANSDVDFTLTVTATSREGLSGPTASTTSTLAVIVNPVADAPTLAVANAAGNEDSAITLSITPAVTDMDGSESISALVVSAIPVGATLSDGAGHTFTATSAANSSVDINGWTLTGLKITPPANSDVDFVLSVTATSREGLSGPTASTTSTLAVTANPLADAPTLAVANATGNEDSAITLSITPAVTDGDGSESISALVVSAIPVGAKLTDGTHTFTATSAANASVDIAGWNLSTLKVTPPANSDVDFTLTLTATSQEGASGPTASTTTSLAVTVNPLADAPAITTADATGTADAPIGLNLSVALTDNDGSEALQTIEIQGVPSAFVLSAGTLTDDGTWVLSQSDLPGLTLVPANGQYAAAGEFTLTVVATSIDGSSTAASTGSIAVSVTPGANATTGSIIDGYIAGATVFADANGNGQLDNGEAFTTTAADGTFTLVNGVGNLVMYGGTDVSTGLPFQGTMKAPAGSTVVTPLTTLVTEIATTALAGNPAPTQQDIDNAIATAQGQVITAFGLAAGTDLKTLDPVAAALNGDTTALSAAIQVQSTIAQVSAVNNDTGAVLSAIANAITAGGGVIDLSDSTTVQSVAQAAGVTDANALAAVTDVVSAANASVQAATDVTELAQAATVAQGAAADALAGTDFGNPTEVAALTNTYVDDLSTQVTNAEVGDVDGATLGTIGNDQLTGGTGVDAIDGLDGDDTIDGAGGNDQLFGGGGRDTFVGGTGNDLIDGGVGLDRAVYTAAAEGISVALATGIVTGGASVGVDTLRSVEAIRGTAFDDSFDASGFNALSTNGGGLGYTIAGGLGVQGDFNEFEGGGGNDTVTGNGSTRISYQNALAAVTVNLTTHTAFSTAGGDAAGIGVDNIVGGVGQVRGSAFNDTLTGAFTVNPVSETFEGMGGNDFIDGNGGFDRVRYDNQNLGALGIQVNLALGTITGRNADATDIIGLDTLRSIESVRGSTSADIFDATGFAATAVGGNLNAGGDQGNFNEFEGMAGDDQIIGNGNTRISYQNATAGVVVDVAAGTADGNASVGHDIFSNVTGVRGSNFADTLLGSTTAANVTENFEGWAGDDLIDGRGGLDRARYDVGPYLGLGLPLTAGMTFNMAVGTATGNDAFATLMFGADTLRSVEMIRGTVADDTYDATNFGVSGANVGSNSTFNEFEGMGGNDTVTGNGNTRVSHSTAMAGVTVTLTATGGGTAASTAPGDAAGIGFDTFVSGVNQVRGSQFDDVISGNNGNETLEGLGGNDTLNGGAGNDRLNGGLGDDALNGGAGGGDIAVFAGLRSAYTFTIPNSGPTAGQVIGITGPDGTDTLTGVEMMEFDTSYVLTGVAANLSPLNNLVAGKSIFGLNTTLSGDSLSIGQQANGRLIDLGTGTDTLTLTAQGGYSLNIAGVENLAATSGLTETVTLLNQVSGISINLGGGTDTLNLANGVNSVTVQNVETVHGGAGSDTVQLAGTGAVTVNAVESVLGTAGADQVTLAADAGVSSVNASFDLGGASDTLTLNVFGTPTINLGLTGVETVNSTGGIETVTLQNVANGLSINLGTGADTLYLADGTNVLTATNVETLNAIGTGNDTVTFIADNSVNQSIFLGGGTNVLNLAGANSTLSLNISGSNLTVYGQTNGGNENVTVLNQQTGTTFDFGAGDDTLQLASLAFGSSDLTVTNIEHVFGSSTFESIHIGGNTGVTEVTGGFGSDWIYASASVDHFRFASLQDSYSNAGQRDIVEGFNAAQDLFEFDDGAHAGMASAIHFIGGSNFSATGQTEAHLTNIGVGVDLLEIDADGDGVIGANDMTIELRSLVAPLTDANFLLI
jgi:hypothetical protein